MNPGLTGIAKWGAVALLAVVAVAGITSALIAPKVPTPAHPATNPSPHTSPAPAPEPAPALTPKALEPPVTPSAPQPAPTAAPLKSTININLATQAELELLPGIGPALAGRIIDYRTQHGPFKQPSDLDNVKGIGEKTLAKLLPLVRVKD